MTLKVTFAVWNHSSSRGSPAVAELLFIIVLPCGCCLWSNVTLLSPCILDYIISSCDKFTPAQLLPRGTLHILAPYALSCVCRRPNKYARRWRPVPGRMMLRMQAMIARGSGIDGIARCRGPCFCSDQTAVGWPNVVGWQVSDTGGSRMWTVCGLVDRSTLVTWSSPLATWSVSSDDAAAAAVELPASADSTDVGRMSSTDMTVTSLTPQRTSLIADLWQNTFIASQKIQTQKKKHLS